MGEELKKRHASWCASLERAVETDGWGQVIEAVEAYERCETCSDGVASSVDQCAWPDPYNSVERAHTAALTLADSRCSSRRRHQSSTRLAKTKRCVCICIDLYRIV